MQLSNLYQRLHGLAFVRTSTLLFLAVALALLDGQGHLDMGLLHALSYTSGVTFYLLAVSHISRKLLFRKQMDVFAEDALDNSNVGAALVYLSMSLVQIVLMWLSLSCLKSLMGLSGTFGS